MAIEEVNNQEEEEENDFFDYAGDILAAPFRGVEGALQGAYNLVDYLAFDVLPDYDTRFLGDSKTMAGDLVESVFQFATGFVPIFGQVGRIGAIGSLAARAGALGKAGKAIQGATAGAITDFTFYNGQEARLSNLIQQYPALQNPVNEFLAHDADEGEIEGRLKNVLEGLGLEALGVGVFIGGLKAIKAGREVLNKKGTPQEVATAMDEKLQGGRVFIDDEAQLAARRERAETDELYRMVGGDPEDIPEVDLRTINWDEVDIEEAVDVAPRIPREEMEAIEAGGKLVDEIEAANGIVKTYEMPGGSTKTVLVDKTNPERVVDLNRYMPAAFHGTPHVFKPKPDAPFGAFEKSKIGTGEGAQKFGHGFYLAESEDVSKFYYRKEIYNHFARDLEDAGVVLDPFYMDDPDFNFDIINQLIKKGITEEGVKIEPRKIKVLKELRDEDWLGFDEPSQSILAAFDDVFNKTNNYDLTDSLKKAVADLGRIYKVDIKPKNEEFLLWDKPIESMPSKVQQIIKGAVDGIRDFDKSFPKDVSPLTGKDFYKLLSRSSVIKNQEAASDFLSEMGIPGIRYLEGGKARKTGEGAHNYVVFSEKDVKVTGTVDFGPTTKGPSAFGTEIDPKTKEFLLKGDEPKTVSNTLDQLTTNAKSPEVRNLAKSLKEIINDPEDLNVPINYDPKAGKPRTTLEGITQTLGTYNPIDDKINLNKAASEETLVHEILHGVTSRKLAGWVGKGEDALKSVTFSQTVKLIDNPKTPKAVRELALSYRKAVSEGDSRIVDMYPTQNLDEFLVGAFTNKEFQELLSRIPAEDNRNLFQKIVDAVAELIGIKGKGTLLEKVIRDGAEIISSSRREAVSPEFTKGLKEFDARFQQPPLKYSKKEPQKFLEAVPEKFRGYADELLKGGTPRLPQFALETGEDVIVLKDLLESYYKENPDKITVQGAVTEVGEEIEKQLMLQQGKDAATKIAEARVVQQSLRDQSKGIIENLTTAVEEYTKAGGGSAAIAKLKNNFQQLLNVADIYRQIGRETGITLQARRENFRARKIGLSQSDIEIEGLRNQFINASGGMHPDKLVKLIKETIDKDNPDSMIASMFKIANKAQGKHFLDMPTEYWMNAILSGPKTQMVNIMGNGLTQLMSTLEAIAGGVVTGNMGLVKAVVASWADGQMIREAAKFAKNAFKQNDNLLDPQARAFSDRPQGAITGDRIASGRLGGIVTERGLTSKKAFDAMGNFIRIPSRLLLTSDEFFKQLAYRRAARLKATMSGIQQGIKDPKQLAEYVNKTLDGVITEGGRMASEEGLAREAADIAVAKKLEGVERDKFILKYVKENFDTNKSALMQYAQDEAQYLTFTRELQDQTLGKVLQEATNKLPMLRLVLPFVRTPTNILKYAFERTPGIVVLREERQRLFADLKSGDPVRRSQAVGKIMTSTAVAGVFVDTIFNNRDRITGGGPRDEKKKAALMATGWRPYSIKIGDTYYSYQRLDPLATLLGVGADLVEVGVNEPRAFDESGVERLFLALTLSITRNATNKSYLAGIQNFTDALSDPDRYMAKFGQNFTSSFVPNIISQMADYDTQALREVRSIGDAFARKLGVRSGLDKKRNLLGEEYLAEQWMGTGFINPIAMSPFKDDPVLAEMASLNHAFRQPPPNLGGQIDMLAHENDSGQTAYDRQLELLQSVKVQGETLRSALTRLVKSNQYQSLEAISEPGLPSPRVQKINSLLTRYRKEAKRQMLTEFPELSEQYARLTAARAGLKGGMQREDVLELLTQ